MLASRLTNISQRVARFRKGVNASQAKSVRRRACFRYAGGPHRRADVHITMQRDDQFLVVNAVLRQFEAERGRYTGGGARSTIVAFARFALRLRASDGFGAARASGAVSAADCGAAVTGCSSAAPPGC